MKFVNIKEKKKWFEILFNNIEQDHIGEFSAQCSYYTILSFIPFIILVLTLVQYTKIEQQVIFDAISKLIPENMHEFVVGIVREVYSKSIGTISVSIIFTIWSAGKGLYALTKGIQGVYHNNIKDRDNPILLRIKSIIHTIIFIFLIVIGLALLVFSKTIIALGQEHFGGFKNYNIIFEVVIQLTFIFVTFIIFLLLYKFMGKPKSKLKSQLIGAIFGAITLNIISFIFSKYLIIFKGFSIMYGSLTTLMLVMMWTYACFYTVFLGAEFNKLYQESNKVKGNFKP